MTDDYALDALDLSDAVEPEVIGVDESGIIDHDALERPYTLAIINAEKKDVTTGSLVEILFRVTDSDSINPKPVRYTLWLPKSTDTADQRNRTKLRLKKFRQALGFSNGEENSFPLDDESLAGYRGIETTAILRVQQDEVYGPSNEIRYFKS